MCGMDLKHLFLEISDLRSFTNDDHKFPRMFALRQGASNPRYNLSLWYFRGDCGVQRADQDQLRNL
eukprot:c12032_g1_i1 orf=34-231(-)